MARPSKYPPEMRERAVRMVAELTPEYPTEFAAIRTVTAKLGIGSDETVRKWVRRAQAEGLPRPGPSAADREEVRELKKEIAELRRANEILKAAAGFFAAELDRPPRYS